MIHQFVLRRLRAGFHLNKGGDRFAVHFVRDADDGGIGDIGVAGQGAFNFLGIDIEAAREDHVFLSIRDIEIALAIPIAQIAGI